MSPSGRRFASVALPSSGQVSWGSGRIDATRAALKAASAAIRRSPYSGCYCVRRSLRRDVDDRHGLGERQHGQADPSHVDVEARSFLVDLGEPIAAGLRLLDAAVVALRGAVRAGAARLRQRPLVEAEDVGGLVATGEEDHAIRVTGGGGEEASSVAADRREPGVADEPFEPRNLRALEHGRADRRVLERVGTALETEEPLDLRVVGR